MRLWRLYCTSCKNGMKGWLRLEYIKALYDDSISGISEDLNRRYEYFLGNSVDPNVAISHKATVDCVIPVKAEVGSVLHILDDGKSFDIIFDGEKSMNARWIRIDAGKEISFSSEKKFFLGKPIPLVQENPHQHKLVLFILIDSLAQTVLEKEGFENLMPNTSAFFSNALYMQECYCCSDWTLPACATVFTGKYPYEHKLVHPSGGKLQHETFVKLFKEAGYLTGYFNSNWRMPPEYGYMDGFDRGVYVFGKYRGKCVSLIESMMDHLYAFPDRDHFITLSLYDLHHHFFMDLPHGVGMQTKESLEEQSYRPPFSLKPTDTPYVPMIAEIYKRQLHFLDYKLQMLYNFLSNNYASSEYAIIFCGDHGESTLSPSDYPKAHVSTNHEMGDLKGNYKKGGRFKYPFMEPFVLSLKKTRAWPSIVALLKAIKFPDHLFVKEQWLHFQSSMQKTPLLIQMNSTTREDVNMLTDLRSVYNIFSRLLKRTGYFNNEIIKEICERKYVYNESIYPGQTYKAKIIDKEYIIYFESNALVDKNCMLKDSTGTLTSFLRKNHERTVISTERLIKYESIIEEHISHLILVG